MNSGPDISKPNRAAIEPGDTTALAGKLHEQFTGGPRQPALEQVVPERDRELFSRARRRFDALVKFDGHISAGLAIDAAIVLAAQFGGTSPTTLRRWRQEYIESGIVSILERKRGNSGRKPKGDVK